MTQEDLGTSAQRETDVILGVVEHTRSKLFHKKTLNEQCHLTFKALCEKMDNIFRVPVIAPRREPTWPA
ncbi:MAG: hypothetical protein H6Q97_38 [Nitrospirae bacterium]|nr:hypothetical protein [Nitrospirota bacterium]